MKPSDKLSEELLSVEKDLDKAVRKIGVYYSPKTIKEKETYIQELKQSIKILRNNNL